MENSLDYLQILESRKYKPLYRPPEQTEVFKIKDAVIGVPQSFCVFSGLPKSGKSTFLTAAIASCFLGVEIFGMKITPPDNRPFVVHVDTESSDYDYYRITSKIIQQSQRRDMSLFYLGFSVRDLSPVEILGAIEALLISNPKIGVVFLDGLLDVVNNYNDEHESRKVITWLKRITKIFDVLLIGVIHTGKKDNFTLGHFGSMIDRYAQSVLIIEKDNDKNTLELKPKFLRSAANFQPIKLAYVGSEYIEI